MDSDVDEDYGVDENYEPNAGTTSQNQNQTVDDANARDVIAGLNLDLGPVQPPTGPDLVMPARPGARSANFGQANRYHQPPLPNYDDMNIDDDALVRSFVSSLTANDDNDNVANVVDRLMRSQIAAHAGPNANDVVLNRIQPQSRAYSVQELTQIRQRRRDQRQQQQLRIILQNCNHHPNLRRLFASINQANRAHDERVLRLVLQQLQSILVVNGATRSHIFGCRTQEARRALRAFVSGVRKQINRRLRAMITRRRAQTQPQSQSRKGGKRQTKTKKRAFKRNKTVKRR
jgi:hypothetical protein